MDEGSCWFIKLLRIIAFDDHDYYYIIGFIKSFCEYLFAYGL